MLKQKTHSVEYGKQLRKRTRAANSPIRLYTAAVIPKAQKANNHKAPVDRSQHNERRGTKPRNLFAVTDYDRRQSERRRNTND